MKLNLREKQSLYHELQQFVSSGIPLTQAVEALAAETSGDVRRLLTRLGELFLQGASVPDAFMQVQPTVSQLEVSLIDASSSSGRLEQAFIYLSNYFGALESVRDKVIRGLTWPVVQLHIGVFVSNLIPLFMGGVSWSGYLFRCIATLVSCYVVGFLLWLGGTTLARAGRTDAAVDAALGRLPLAGKLRRNLALSRFCATYEMQLQAGINVYDSLRAAADASQSARIQSFIAAVLPQVRSGESFGSTLKDRGVLPTAFQRAVRLGEETGNLDENLRRWSDYYQKAALSALDSAGIWIPRAFYVLIGGYLIYCVLVAGQSENQAIQRILDTNY